MNIEEINRHCDRFEERLKRGDSLSVKQFLAEERLPHNDRLLEELSRVRRDYVASAPHPEQAAAHEHTQEYAASQEGVVEQEGLVCNRPKRNSLRG